MSKSIIEKLGISEAPWKMMLTSNKEWTTRNDSGILFKYWKPTKYPDQFERYELEMKESFNNARLVTNAPEMLEALIETCLHWEAVRYFPNCFYQNNVEAIKKATGKTWEEIKDLLNA